MIPTLQSITFTNPSSALKILNPLKERLKDFHFNALESTLTPNAIQSNIILWFVAELDYDEIIDQAKIIPHDLISKTLLVDYSGESPLHLLEQIKALGLISSSSIQNWISETPPQFIKLGQGQGIFGKKRYFSSEYFDDFFFKVQNSEKYMIFYNYDIHDLGAILEKYIRIASNDLYEEAT